MLLVWVERIVPLCFSGNGSFTQLFVRQLGIVVRLVREEAVKLYRLRSGELF